MKLTSGIGIGEMVPRLLADTLKRIGATEIASYRIEGENEVEVHVLAATDRGLADVRVIYTQRGRQVEIVCSLQSWRQVSAGLTVTVKAGMGDRAEGGKIVLPSGEGMTIDREEHTGQAFDDFAATLLEYARHA